MLDLKYLRQSPEEAERRLQSKEPDVLLGPILELDERLRKVKTESEGVRSQRNQLAKQIGMAKGRGEAVEPLMQEAECLRERETILDEQLSGLEIALDEALLKLPNLPDPEVKAASDPKENECIASVGQKPSFSFAFKNHVELNERLQLFDFKRGAKVAGSGWTAYRGVGARLEWALINFMLDHHLENGFEMIMPPLVARPEIATGSSHLPKFDHQLFRIFDSDYHLYLIPTAEMALNGLHYDEILPSSELPKRYVAYTPCFRREAGAAGSQERGLIRTHQFNKVEMFAFTRPEESDAMMQEMVKSACSILEALGLHHRAMRLVTGDMSFAASTTIDIEVWLPGQDRYYEVSSVSNCRDFCARRSGIRHKGKEGKPELVHTLNGSGVATSRLMVALLENNQREDGSVALPVVLHKYLNGLKEIQPLA